MNVRYLSLMLLCGYAVHATVDNGAEVLEVVVQPEEVAQVEDQVEGDDTETRGGCKTFNAITVCGLAKLGSLQVTNNATVGGSLTVNGVTVLNGGAAVTGSLTVGGSPVLTSLKSWGQAYSTAALAGTGSAINVPFSNAGAQNKNITVAGSNITLANVGIYLVRYSALFGVTTQLTQNTTYPNYITFMLNGSPLTGAGYVSLANFGADVSGGGVPVGTTLETSGAFIIATTSPNSILVMQANMQPEIGLPASAGAPAANATVEIIQLN